MLEDKLFTILKTLNIEVAYDHFVSANVEPPFILYRNTDSNTFKADDKTYLRANSYIIDLITVDKNIELENQLENVLNENNLPYDKEEDFLENEKIYQIRYFI